MILADTSVWVEYDRATGSAVEERLSRLIADDGPVAVTEPIVMEVFEDEQEVGLVVTGGYVPRLR